MKLFDALFQLLYRLSPSFSAELERRLPEDGVIFDVGSFRGDFSRYFLQRRRGRPGTLKVFLFDGNPETVPMVADLLSPNVTIHQLALSDRSGEQEFFINTLIPSSGTGLNPVVKTSSWVRSRTRLMNLIGQNRQGRSSDAIFDTVKVQSQTLDSFCRDHGVDRIDILKIDVEGAEQAVLAELGRGRVDTNEAEVRGVEAERGAVVAADVEDDVAGLERHESLQALGFLPEVLDHRSVQAAAVAVVVAVHGLERARRAELDQLAPPTAHEVKRSDVVTLRRARKDTRHRHLTERHQLVELVAPAKATQFERRHTHGGQSCRRESAEARAFAVSMRKSETERSPFHDAADKLTLSSSSGTGLPLVDEQRVISPDVRHDADAAYGATSDQPKTEGLQHRLDVGGLLCVILLLVENLDLDVLDPSFSQGRARTSEDRADIVRHAGFFDLDTYRRLAGPAQAKIVTSISMFYDLPEPLTFARGVAALLADDGAWHLEQSYLPLMLENNAYDTICHEHIEYYGLAQIVWILDQVGLGIAEVELNDVNGGSFAVTAKRGVAHAPKVAELLAKERSSLDDHAWQRFSSFVAEHRARLVQELARLRQEGATVFAVGASTKGNVLLQACDIDSRMVKAVGEINQEKVGRETPGTRLPIIAEADMLAQRPDVLLILPWHFRSHMLRVFRPFVEQGGRLLFPLPQIEIVDHV